MKMFYKRANTLAVFISLTMTATCLFAQEKELFFGEQEVFKVSKSDMPIKIDGKLDEEAWQKTESRSLNYFSFRRRIA